MKVISFSIYKDNPKYFNYYLRGLYFNMRMIKTLLPDYTMVINASYEVVKEHNDYLTGLGVKVVPFYGGDRCYNMMQRFSPAYSDAEIVLCRDSDSCITYREMLEIRKWEESCKNWHGINDNPAHSIPMMGGMIGFKSEALRSIYPEFRWLINVWDLSKHGSDQNLIMQRLWNIAQHSFYHSDLKNREPQPTNDSRWESDLVQRYIGSAGVIEMELVRFLERHNNDEWIEFEKKHPKIFYWHD